MVSRVKVYQPGLKVTLYKTIQRTTLDGKQKVSGRFQGIDQKVDLTPFLGEGSSVRTSKSVRDAAGGFSLAFADKPYKDMGSFETLYGIIEPMDFIEIRMEHAASPLMPIVMRGFVSEVQRVETMGNDGKPQRSTVVTGQDYGKLWQMLQILYLPGYVVGQDMVSNFKLFERFGVGFKTTQKAGEFVSEVVKKILNPYLKNLMPENSPNPKEVKIDEEQLVKHGTTSVTGPQSQEGSIYDLLRTYSDVGIWNELFLEDREDGVYCVYRPNPAKSIDGKLIQEDAKEPTVVSLMDDDVLSMTVSRTDANVANFYWVRAPRFELVSEMHQKLFSVQGADKETVLLDDYENTKSKLYGTRVMYGQTEQGGDDVETFNSGLPKEQHGKRNTDMANWVKDRRRIMVEQNKDNVLLERGVLRVRGNEKIKPGCYIHLQRGGFTADYYVVQVDHDYMPFQGFFSTLIVDRGMGFVERSKREGGADSPYLAELFGTNNG